MRVPIAVLVFAASCFCFVSAGLAFRSFGPLWHIHLMITRDAVKTEFSDRESLIRVAEASENADRGAKLNDSALHFDNEDFAAGTRKLAVNLNAAVDLLAACEKQQAIDSIGDAVHAVQDFYSHSNWVENNLVPGANVQPSDIPINPSLVSLGADGMFVAGPLTADPNFVAFPGACFAAPPNPPDTVITSGFYPDEPRTANKCSHSEINKDYSDPSGAYGNPRGAFPVSGIPLFAFAVDVASRHTQALWQDLKQALVLRFGQQQGTEIYNRLIKKQRDIAFCLDVSFSMEDELPAIKTKVIEHVNALAASPEISPKLSLVTFDNVVRFEGTACSTSEFLGWINTLSAVGGSGCGEGSITALLRAVERVGEGGTVVFATDEPPNEGAALKDELKRQAKKKDVKLQAVWERLDCSPLLFVEGEGGTVSSAVASLGAEVYAELAAATGGLSFPTLANLDLALETILETTTPRLYDFQLVERSTTFDAPELARIPVDSSVERVDFLLTSTGSVSHTLEVRRPDGAIAMPTDADATFLDTPTFHRVRIMAPALGVWKMDIRGEGAYQASAMGISDIALFDVRFLRVEDVGDSIPRVSEVAGSLNPGETFEVEIQMLGEIGNVSFDLVLPNDLNLPGGTSFHPLPAIEGIPGLGTFAAQYTPDSAVDRFLVRATGTDTTGAPFVRILRRSFSVASLAVRPPDSQASQSGCSITYTFEVTNFGAPGGFTITASSENNLPIALNPSALTLGAQETGYVDAFISIPLGTPDLYDEMTLVVIGSTPASVPNVATVITAVESGVDCNCNAVRDVLDIALGASLDCNTDGQPDECGVFIPGCDATETERLTAPDPQVDSRFGRTVSVSGDTAVVGTRLEDCFAGPDCGAAYVYRQVAGTWILEAKLTESDVSFGGLFGSSVSISGDVALVGKIGDDCASGTICGSAYIFRRSGAVWVQEAKLTALDADNADFFGVSVSIGGDTALVGAMSAGCLTGGSCGAAYVFHRVGTTWTQEAKLTATAGAFGNQFGQSVSISGDLALVGEPGRDCPGVQEACGAAYMYRRSGATWIQEAKLTLVDDNGGDQFGISVSLDGEAAVVGTYRRAAYVYRFDGANWVQEAELTAPDAAHGAWFGRSVGITGETIVVRSGPEVCAVGGDTCGSAHVYRRSGGTWAQAAKLTASDATASDDFGASVAVGGDLVIVGSDLANCAAGLYCGAAYVFDLPVFDCNCNGVADTCDIANGSADCNGNRIPDACETFLASAPVADPILNAAGATVASVKNRFLSFSVTEPGQKAVRVKFVSLPGAFSMFNGTTAWVASPFAASELPGKSFTDPVGTYPTFMAGQLSAVPVFADWSAFGVVHVYDERIIPSRKVGANPLEPALYEIQLVSDGCDVNSEASFSPPLAITNPRWGDVASLVGGQYRAPDGSVDMTSDVLGVLAKFGGAANAPIKARAEMVGTGPGGSQPLLTGKIEISDVLAVQSAFAGNSYPFPPP